MYNLGHTYLTFWSPVINVARDPRWGRIMETPGEDAFTIGKYSVNFVRGLQDVEGFEVTSDLNTRPIKIASCCKHFAAYDIENWYFSERFSFNARVTEQDMVESFNLPFEMCIKEGDSTSAMCSYNQVNGFPSCADPKLLTQTIRGEWNLHGYIVSDCYIYQYLHDNQKWLNLPKEELVAKVINAGLDLECGWDHHDQAILAVKQGKLREKEIDRALKNLYLVLMRVGFFDGMEKYDSFGTDHICTQEHMDLAADAARQGIVLLKNVNNTLPLNKDIHKKLALGGTHVNATDAMKGNYAGTQCRFVTPLNALQADANVTYVLGCDLYCNNKTVTGQMKNATSGADATVLFMGIDASIEGETIDRRELLLNPGQVSFIEEVANASKNPIVLVILSAGGLDVSFAKDNDKIGAILWAGYPGQEGGRAIADVIYGRYNPGGRLPITWYPNNYTESIPMTSMQFRPDQELGYPGRTYKFYDGPTVYPFGYGLSYTTFNYTLKANPTKIETKLEKYQKCLQISTKNSATSPQCPSAVITTMPCNETIDFEVEVANIGKVDGSDAVIVYAVPPEYVDGAPIKQVVAFDRVFVGAGKSQVVKFSVNVCQRLSVVEKTAYRVLPAGAHKIVIGDSSVSFDVDVELVY
ncbi:uncharacterized protein A4U43_C03F10030 [Asparagus officinalis]|uniref:Fibronectin type III-like domain-containing protein n=2 Tax=Asparagus officinalis TaxID=4686 RepID=A0A5P1F8R5_ASPOF|nr:uncharacterized protein A4U43_C03F10030 [Asparagus officinalis]